MRLGDLHWLVAGKVELQGSLTAADWVDVLGFLARLSDRRADSLFAALDVSRGGHVFAWWSC
jgi:hypothetical protein